MGLEIVSVRLKQEGTLYDTLPTITDSKTAAEVFRHFLEDSDREILALLTLDSQKTPINISVISIGTLNHSLAHPREIFKTAILSNADSIILAHNHPSGNPIPSQQDYEITSRMKDVGILVGIALLDHIVIGSEGQYYSFAEQDSDALCNNCFITEFKKDAYLENAKQGIQENWNRMLLKKQHKPKKKELER